MMITYILAILLAVSLLPYGYAVPAISLINPSKVEQKSLKTQGEFESKMLFPPPSKTRGVLWIGNNVRWPNGIVPYEFAPGYTVDQQSAVVNGMRKLESFTALNNIICVQFRPRVSSDVYYITIRNGSGCSSYVGLNGGITMERTVTLQASGCLDVGRVMQQLLHVLGFHHEHTRSDRDSYVNVSTQNIKPGLEDQFIKYNNTVVNTLNTSYDYASLLHYKKYDFSSNWYPTIVPIQANVKIGQRYKLTSTDQQIVQLFYTCSAVGTPLPTTTPMTPSANTSIYSSALTSNNLLYTRSADFANNYYYEVIDVTAPINGTYKFECLSYLDSFASVYDQSFNASDPTANLLWSFDDRDDDNWEFGFSLIFYVPYTITLVITTYDPNVTGPFSVVVTGPTKAILTRKTSTIVPTIASTTTTRTTTIAPMTTRTTTTASTTTTRPTTTTSTATTRTTSTTSTTTIPSTTTTSTTTTRTTTTTSTTTTRTTTTTTTRTTTTTSTTTTRTTTTTSTTTTRPTTTASTTTTRTTTTTSTTTTRTTTSTSTTTTTTSTTTTTTSTTTTKTSTTTLTTTTVTSVTAGGYLSLNYFYPFNLSQTTCPNGYSWTMWFNVGQPNITVGSDKEDMSIILARYPTAICRIPYGIHGQPVNARVSNWTVTIWQSYQANNTLYLLSLQSVQSGDIDLRVRYCCPTGSFVTPTTTTTTPRPVDSNTCGIQQITPRSTLMTRIYGGTETIPNSWPWMIYYQESKSGNSVGVCGATLLNNNYVLTAAHCIGTNNASAITLIGGMHNRTSGTETTRQWRTAEAIYVHQQYSGAPEYRHDIAILRVSIPFVFSSYVQPACLPGAEPQANDVVTIVGWGAQFLGGGVNNVLKQASTRVVGDCDSFWSTVDNSRQICVADRITGNSACQGDSGGPILSQYQGQYVVSGVTSYGDDCNTLGSKMPNVYTRVKTYMNWIKSIIQ